MRELKQSKETKTAITSTHETHLPSLLMGLSVFHTYPPISVDTSRDSSSTGMESTRQLQPTPPFSFSLFSFVLILVYFLGKMFRRKILLGNQVIGLI